MAALWIWRQFPRQIASDLRTAGLHIKHWLRGTIGDDGDLILSSYELLETLEFLSEESAFKTIAERGGRWPMWKRALAEILNEAYRYRSGWQAAKIGAEGAFDVAGLEFVDPVDRELRDKAERAESARLSESSGRFESEIGFSVESNDGRDERWPHH